MGIVLATLHPEERLIQSQFGQDINLFLSRLKSLAFKKSWKNVVGKKKCLCELIIEFQWNSWISDSYFCNFNSKFCCLFINCTVFLLFEMEKMMEVMRMGWMVLLVSHQQCQVAQRKRSQLNASPKERKHGESSLTNHRIFR